MKMKSEENIKIDFKKREEMVTAKCSSCEHLLEGILNNIPSCKYDLCLFEIKEKQRKGHKCKGCKWGTFTGLKYFCMLPRCMPELGSFNGVDKNGR